MLLAIRNLPTGSSSTNMLVNIFQFCKIKRSMQHLIMRTLLGPWKNVLIRKVSWFQGWNNTHLYCIGTKWSVLIIQEVLISGSPHLGVPLYSEQPIPISDILKGKDTDATYEHVFRTWNEASITRVGTSGQAELPFGGGATADYRSLWASWLEGWPGVDLHLMKNTLELSLKLCHFICSSPLNFVHSVKKTNTVMYTYLLVMWARDVWLGLAQLTVGVDAFGHVCQECNPRKQASGYEVVCKTKRKKIKF